MKIKWISSELHNHTIHSDGRQSPEEMVKTFANKGIELIALTDHNSITGHDEFVKACNKYNVAYLRGNEATTFYGHVLGLGVKDHIDWRRYHRDNVDELCDEIRHLNGLAGLAHPFRLGYPINNGCAWLFRVKDYGIFDYIEIINTSDPGRCLNHMAIDLWKEQLRKGLKITALAGKDWHGRPKDQGDFVTYLGIDEGAKDIELGALDGVKSGRAYVSKIGAVDMYIEDEDGYKYTIGQCCSSDTLPIKLCIDFITQVPAYESICITLNDEKGVFYEKVLEKSDSYSIDITEPHNYMVIEIFKGTREHDNLLLISNPIYTR